MIYHRCDKNIQERPTRSTMLALYVFVQVYKREKPSLLRDFGNSSLNDDESLSI